LYLEIIENVVDRVSQVVIQVLSGYILGVLHEHLGVVGYVIVLVVELQLVHEGGSNLLQGLGGDNGGEATIDIVLAAGQSSGGHSRDLVVSDVAVGVKLIHGVGVEGAKRLH